MLVGTELVFPGRMFLMKRLTVAEELMRIPYSAEPSNPVFMVGRLKSVEFMVLGKSRFFIDS